MTRRIETLTDNPATLAVLKVVEQSRKLNDYLKQQATTPYLKRRKTRYEKERYG